MKNIIISSSNKHKISEIITTIKPLFDKIYSLSDFPDIGDIKEDGTSIVENSFIKSRVAFNHTKLPSMADDTVLEVDHLMGDPGIYTARYGYDPIFYASAQSMSLGDMGLEQKNQISHRAIAIQKFADKIKRLMYA